MSDEVFTGIDENKDGFLSTGGKLKNKFHFSLSSF